MEKPIAVPDVVMVLIARPEALPFHQLLLGRLVAESVRGTDVFEQPTALWRRGLGAQD